MLDGVGMVFSVRAILRDGLLGFALGLLVTVGASVVASAYQGSPPAAALRLP